MGDLEENWGPAPGNLNSDGQNLVVYGKKFGNVFIGVQPSFGYEGDPMRLLFAKSASPHHGFAAYYTYLSKIFKADAVLHFGTHGSLEFMPGKQVGMSGTCYPDRLIGPLPSAYLYAANNPSEATIAKRRSYAATVSYLTPPAENAGLYKGLKELKELISSYQGLRENEGRGPAIVNSIVSTAWTCNLDKDIADLPALETYDAKMVNTEERDYIVGKVYAQIMQIESRLLPCGLHTVGVPPTAEEAIATLVNISLREASARVFSNSAGSYSANVGIAIENGGWEDESQLQEQFLTRKGFAFNADKPGMMEQQADLFKAALKNVDVTFQNLDSSEISITDVSHYYDSDPTKVVQGLRHDKKKPMSSMADTTTANAQVRTLSETVRLDARTKLLNPKFYEGMLSTGYEGVREVQKRLRNTLGWSATAGEVDNFVFEDANDVFINDAEMQQRLLDSNPNAFRDMVTTFLEANGRGYWETSDENIERLQELYAEVEDRIEGV